MSRPFLLTVDFLGPSSKFARAFGLAAMPVRHASETASPTEIDADLELLRAGCRGDDAAFRRLVERHQRRLLTVCERLLGSSEEAQDTVQDAFLQAFRKGERFRPVGRVGAWLYRIAVNLSLKRLRRKRLIRFVGFGRADEQDAAHLPADPSAGPEDRLAARRRWLSTRRWIDELPEAQRVALILVRFEGLTIREAAEVLGTSEKAVEGKLSRALAKLKAKQDQAGGPHA